jgi:hypothetical protein
MAIVTGFQGHRLFHGEGARLIEVGNEHFEAGSWRVLCRAAISLNRFSASCADGSLRLQKRQPFSAWNLSIVSGK